jgi:hypothetical protein
MQENKDKNWKGKGKAIEGKESNSQEESTASSSRTKIGSSEANINESQASSSKKPNVEYERDNGSSSPSSLPSLTDDERENEKAIIKQKFDKMNEESNYSESSSHSVERTITNFFKRNKDTLSEKAIKEYKDANNNRDDIVSEHNSNPFIGKEAMFILIKEKIGLANHELTSRLLNILNNESGLSNKDRIILRNINENNDVSKEQLNSANLAGRDYVNTKAELGTSSGSSTNPASSVNNTRAGSNNGSNQESNDNRLDPNVRREENGTHFPQDTSDILLEYDMPSYTDPED